MKKNLFSINFLLYKNADCQKSFFKNLAPDWELLDLTERED